MVRNFWWGQKGSENKLAWMSWDKLCRKKSDGGMGFREMEAFNLALLAKQGWRILTRLDSLATKVLKSKYFPNASFWEASAGSRASFIWRSILQARLLLQNGVRWRIGDGYAVNGRNEPWVPRLYSFRVSQINKEFWPEATVGHFIDHVTGQWKTQLLQQYFLEFEGELIEKIPILPGLSPDIQVWHYSNDGQFTVKSAYHLFLELQKNQKGTGSSSTKGAEHGFWKKLWKLEIPPRVKVFLWRAINGALATSSNIEKRLNKQGLICSSCRSLEETDKHIFFECPVAKEVWKELSSSWIAKSKNFRSFKDWYAAMMEAQNQKETESISIVLWLLWKSRNERIFEGFICPAKQISNYGKLFLREYQLMHPEEMTSIGYQIHQVSDSRWKPPVEGHLKLNVDASFSEQGLGIGVIVRNCIGEVEVIMAEKLPQLCDAEHAETLGFLKAVEFAQEYGISHFELEEDALCVVKKLNNTIVDLSKVGHLIDRIRQLIKLFPSVTISHVKRQLNRPAHEASKLAISLIGRKIWWSNFPSSVMEAANLDSQDVF